MTIYALTRKDMVHGEGRVDFTIPPYTGPFTFESWLYVPARPGMVSVILEMGPFYLLLEGGMNDGNYTFSVCAKQSRMILEKIRGSDKPSPGWVHLALTYEKPNLNIYIEPLHNPRRQSGADLTTNLSRISSAEIETDLAIDSIVLRLGMEPIVEGLMFAEVRLWRKALDPNTIKRNRKCVFSAASPDLLGYWNFENNSANDLSANHHNGYLSGNYNIVEVNDLNLAPLNDLDLAPLLELDPDGTPTVLAYSLPEPTTYRGRHIIQLDYPESSFTNKAKTHTNKAETQSAADEPSSDALPRLQEALKQAYLHGYFDPQHFPNVLGGNDEISLQGIQFALRDLGVVDTRYTKPQIASGSAILETYTIEFSQAAQTILDYSRGGKRLTFYRDLSGQTNYRFIHYRSAIKPSLLLVEYYRLTSFTSEYGAGRTIKTFSLLPGEKTRIKIRSFRRSELTMKQSSSIVDSTSQETETEFMKSILHEQGNQDDINSSYEYRAETGAEASGSWGWGNASVEASGGISGVTNSSRNEFGKNVSDAVTQNVARASSKRDIHIDTAMDYHRTEEEEDSIERTLENVNVSRTLNFAFRQLNQEYITLLHLVDVRVAFYNGQPESTYEVPLSDLDRLLKQYVVPQGDVIDSSLQPVFDEAQDAVDNLVQQIEKCFGLLTSYPVAEILPEAGQNQFRAIGNKHTTLLNAATEAKHSCDDHNVGRTRSQLLDLATSVVAFATDVENLYKTYQNQIKRNNPHYIVEIKNASEPVKNAAKKLPINPHWDQIKRQIQGELGQIQDYLGASRADFVKRVDLNSDSYYLQVNPDCISSYQKKNGDLKFEVPGVVISANTHIMRTDGVVVDSFLGQGMALDDYSNELQIEKIKSQRLDNELLEARVQRNKILLGIFDSADISAATRRAKMFQQMFNPQLPQTKIDIE